MAASSIPQATVQAFINLSQGGTWDQLKARLILMAPLENRLEYLEQMKDLVRTRDLVDFVIYREAVLRIFPNTHFSITPQPDGTTATTSDGRSFIADKWYIFEVRNSAAAPSLGETGKCIIKIHAPGSRKVTSDIDTSILTKIEGNFSTVHATGWGGVPHIGGRAVAKRITNAVIDGFYRLSEEVFRGITSSTHRDSNAYADFLTYDAQEYPKFDYETYNPLIAGDRVFKQEAFTQAFKEYKLQKHLQEQAASLFSLRLSLTDSQWLNFKEHVKKTWEDLFPDYELTDVIPEMHQDWETIFQKVEKLHQDYLVALGDSVEEDRIKVMNANYVKQLQKCADLDEKIEAAEQEKARLTEELKAKAVARQRAKKVWNDLPKESEDEDTKALAHKKNFEYAQLDGKCAELQEMLRACISTIATTKLEKQLEQIKASMFANEAYVCRSAVYHVVNAQKGATFSLEKGAKFRMTEQTFLASALQQVGFKLLHSQELRRKEKSPGEVAYLTAKYGQRIYSLIFNKKVDANKKPIPVEDRDLEALARGRGKDKLGTFSWMKSEKWKSEFYRALSPEELLLLNYQAKLIAEVKDNGKIAEDKKADEALERLRVLATSLKIEGADREKKFQEREHELFLSIAAKLIAIVCASKLERHQHLWGYEVALPRAGIPAAVEEPSTPSEPKPTTPSAQSPTAPSSSLPSASTKQSQGSSGIPIVTIKHLSQSDQSKFNAVAQTGGFMGIDQHEMKDASSADFSDKSKHEVIKAPLAGPRESSEKKK